MSGTQGKGVVRLVGLAEERKVLTAAMQQGQPALLIGETGTGKTSLVQEIAATLHRNVIRVNLDGGTTPDELVGRYQLKGGQTFFEEGILIKAMKEGCILLLDELNAALPETLFVIHAVLERPARLLIPETGVEVQPASGFVVVATMNPTHEYAGTRALNHALLSRFTVVLRIKALRGEKLLQALEKHVPAATATVISLLGAAIECCQQLYQKEKLTTRVTLREGIGTLRLITEGGLSVDDGIEHGLFGRLEAHELREVRQVWKDTKPPFDEETPIPPIAEILKASQETMQLKAELHRVITECKRYDRLSAAVREILGAPTEAEAVPAPAPS